MRTNDNLHSSPLSQLPSLHELHLGCVMKLLPEYGDGPMAVQVLQRLLMAAPALRLIRPARVALGASQQNGQALSGLLSMLAGVAQARTAGGLELDVSPTGTCSLCELLEAARQPMRSVSSLTLLNSIALGPADRLAARLRAALPNVELLTCCYLAGMQQQELQALARGLPKLVHVRVRPTSRAWVVTPDCEVVAFACVWSEQRRGSGRSSLPCLRMEVPEGQHLAAEPLWPLSQQSAQHPGVEVWTM
jgi:hypothetical protein